MFLVSFRLFPEVFIFRRGSVKSVSTLSRDVIFFLIANDLFKLVWICLFVLGYWFGLKETSSTALIPIDIDCLDFGNLCFVLPDAHNDSNIRADITEANCVIFLLLSSIQLK